MKYKTSELTEGLLDAAVAQAKGWPYSVTHNTWPNGVPNVLVVLERKPSTDWAHAGSIIEHEICSLLGPCVTVASDGSLTGRNLWEATAYTKSWALLADGAVSKPPSAVADTPLVAAMRAFVLAALGDEVEL